MTRPAPAQPTKSSRLTRPTQARPDPGTAAADKSRAAHDRRADERDRKSKPAITRRASGYGSSADTEPGDEADRAVKRAHSATPATRKPHKQSRRRHRFGRRRGALRTTSECSAVTDWHAGGNTPTMGLEPTAEVAQPDGSPAAHIATAEAKAVGARRWRASEGRRTARRLRRCSSDPQGNGEPGPVSDAAVASAPGRRSMRRRGDNSSETESCCAGFLATGVAMRASVGSVAPQDVATVTT